MPQISYIKYADVKEAHRYDAEYFRPEYTKNDEIISKKKWERCINMVERDITKGETPLWQGFDYITDGIPFVRSQNFKNFGINRDDLVFVSSEYNKLKKRSIIKPKDTLLAIVGATIGEVGFYDLTEEGNCNQAVAIISPKNELSKEYFNILFRTRNIQLQISRSRGGNARDNFDLFEVRNLKIPILPRSFQIQIEQIVKLAHQKQTQSKQLYHEAEELLLQELGLLDYQVKHELTFSTTKKEIEEARRYDSEYFQPKYAEIIKKIEEYEGGWDFVKNQFKQNTTLSKKDGDYCNYIEISDVNVSNGEITPNRVEIKNVPANGKRKLFKDDLLISKVRPYRGAISFIDFEVDNLLGSGAFTVLQEKTKYKKEVLMIFLKTIFIKELLLRYNCGTSYPVIKDEDILNLKIPLIKPSIQKQISEKIQESHRLRKESKELLEEAKRKVEEEIEKGIV